MPRLFEQLRITHGDGSYARLMGQLLKTDLLILDDWGMQKVTAQQRQDLMEVIEDRHGRGSTLIASQLPTEHWHDYIGSATLTRAGLALPAHHPTAWVVDCKSDGSDRGSLRSHDLTLFVMQDAESTVCVIHRDPFIMMGCYDKQSLAKAKAECHSPKT